MEIPTNSFEFNHLSKTLPAYYFPKFVGLRTGEVLYDKVYMSHRSPPKISLKYEWTKEVGSKLFN